MKISELRGTIEGYDSEKLRLIVTEIYRIMPKKLKEEKVVDKLIENPNEFLDLKKKKQKQKRTIDLDYLKSETDQFLKDAYAQNYFAPNRMVPKQRRSKWRSVFKQFYKDWLSVASEEKNLAIAAEYMERLYKVLCYGSSYYIFVSEQPFRAISIPQDKFFEQFCALLFKLPDKKSSVKKSIKLIVDEGTDHETFPEDLMLALVPFLKTPDLKLMAIAEIKEFAEKQKEFITRKMASAKPNIFYQSISYSDSSKSEYLAKFGFICYCYLDEFENAISFLKKYYVESDAEIKLFVLLQLLFEYNLPDLWLKEYELAKEKGIQPRDSLRKTYQLLCKNAEF